MLISLNTESAFSSQPTHEEDNDFNDTLSCGFRVLCTVIFLLESSWYIITANAQHQAAGLELSGLSSASMVMYSSYSSLIKTIMLY